jgi:transcriptional regulator with XRE-family HTH domain
MDPNALFGQNVRNARLAANMSQEDLAFRAELDRTYVSGIERGVRNPTVAVIVQLASVLGIPAADLFLGIGRHGSRARQRSNRQA